MVTFSYFRDAIARSTATAVERYLKAYKTGNPLDKDTVTIKGRPWNHWIQREEGEEEDAEIKWGHGHIVLATEKARSFWMECLEEEYLDNDGSAKKTGVHDAGTIDGRIQYHLSIPSLVWNGLTRKTGDQGSDKANPLDCFLDMVKTMSGGNSTAKDARRQSRTRPPEAMAKPSGPT
jgi:hypothetical protein